jgi:hypothetical protein
MVFTPKKTSRINVKYLETLKTCTKTVTDLYKKHVAYFPEEYIALVSKSSVPNGTILRIPKTQSSDGITIKFMRYNKCSDLTDDEVFELVNSWVYLEEGQTALNYLDLYFNYIIEYFSITKYRLKQMYHELELDEDDDLVADPDYTPELDSEDYHEELEYKEDETSDYSQDGTYSHDPSDESSGSGDTLNLETTEFEFKTPGEETDYEDDDSDKSPDYVPSVESEDEYENNHRKFVVTKKRAVRKTRLVSKRV